ncbi:MAG: SOS response-associated peptidase [Actinomycetes bacterium]
MCGRYAASRSPDDLVEEFEVVEDRTRDPESPPVSPDYNIAPTKTAPVVLERRPRTGAVSEDGVAPSDPPGAGSEGDGSGGGVDDGTEPGRDTEAGAGGGGEGGAVRQLRPLVWGLVPSWAKDRSVGSRLINARAESLLEKPAFRKAAIGRRCLVPADGWYEWQKSPTVKDRKGKPRKQPFFVSDSEGDVLAFAGVYEFWRDPERDPEDPEAWLTTYAIVTTSAVGQMERLHDRMPLALPREHWDRWLDPDVQDPDEVRGLLVPGDVARFVLTPVSTLVNNVRNEGPELVEPLAVEDLVGVVDPVTGEVYGGQGDALF